MNRKRKAFLVLLLLLLLTAGLYFDGELGRWFGGEARTTRSGPAIAKLASTYSRVKHRKRDKVQWDAASTGMPLADGDKIRTEQSSQAKVKFITGSELVVEENSLVTIHAARSNSGGTGEVADVEIEDGRVRATLSRAPDGTDRTLKIHSANGGVTEVSTRGTKDGFAEVSMVMRPDRSSRIVVNRGEAKVSGMGETITLDAGQSATSDGTAAAVKAATTALPVALPSGPEADAEIATTSTASMPTIQLAWNSVPGASRYAVEVASDAAFERLASVSEVPGSASSYSFVPAAPGEYHWRILTLDSNRVAGAASAERSFRVVHVAPPSPTPTPAPTPIPTKSAKPTPKPTLPPPNLLQANLGEPLKVSGLAKRGARQVTVNGKPAKLAKDGHYEVALDNLPAGPRTIVIESIYEDGTVTYEKRQAMIRPPP